MCDCIKKVEDRSFEFYQKKFPDRKVEEFEFTNKALSLNYDEYFLYLPIGIRYKQGSRLKKDTMNMHFTFCPFCGEKIQRGA